MKKILITGVNSYIGNSFYDWIDDPLYINKYSADKISLRGKNASDVDFSPYECVLYVTGIAHADTNKNNTSQEVLYRRINTELTLEMAKKAKSDGVKQFIFLSSIIVYGSKFDAKDKGIINSQTSEQPDGFYGESKLMADKGLLPLSCEDFRVAVIRPPMVYGKGSKGNYPKLAKLAGISPLFPDFENRRSMIHIDNLCELIRLIIDNESFGMFFPQNREYVKTSELVRLIAKKKGKKIILTKLFNPIINVLLPRVGTVRKLFGDLVYDKELSRHFNFDYCVNDLEQSIEKTE